MRNYKLFIVILFSIIPVASPAGEITKVTVRNSDFEVINVLHDQKTISLFRTIWEKKTQLPSGMRPPNTYEYKIDIEPGNRWLYDPAGYVQVLSKAKVNAYSIYPTAEFNNLLGIPKSGSPLQR